MTWLSFFSELIKAVAWPVVAITMSLFFRKELRALLNRIKRGKIGSAEFEFEQEVQALEETVINETDTHRLTQQASPTLVELASIDPGSAILKAWSTVERAVIRLAEVRGRGMAVERLNIPNVLRGLEKSGVVPSELAVLFHELRALRNHAAHDPDFAPSNLSVLNYINISTFLVGNLDKIAQAA